MCGIAGIVSLNRQTVSLDIVKKMGEMLKHRGPDGEGYWLNEDKNIGFGHRRLSIIDLSSKGSQPMKVDEYVITYNGEVYNYKELREELILDGIVFQSESDTEVILNAYIKWGEKCINHFNGMWSFVIYDPIKKKIFCSRDRYGIKPFYYVIINDQFYFASEIKAFTVIDGWNPALNKTRAYDFIVNGLVNHTHETLFENVFELRGGYNLTIESDSNKVLINQYYSINDIQVNDESYNENALISSYRKIFDSAVEISLRSDVKVGSALSGGIDSSCLVGSINQSLVSSKMQSKQECVSACFQDHEIDESFYIDAVSEKININVHKVYPNFEEFKNNFEKLIWHQEEPFPTLSIFAQYCVFSEAANNHLTVMLDGQGADEVLAGYDVFYKPYFIKLFKSNFIKAINTLFNYFKLHSKYPILNVINKIIKPKNEIMGLIDKQYFESVLPFKSSSASTINQISVNHFQEYGLHSLLRYEDKNSMTFSIESRVPFLDHRLVEFGLQMPDSLKIKNGVRKYILREACKNILPDVVYKRFDKNGFLTPQELWTASNQQFFKNELNRAIKNCNPIFSNELSKHFDINMQKMNKTYIFMIWRIISFNKWVEVYNVSIK